jgi:hypothetical protein
MTVSTQYFLLNASNDSCGTVHPKSLDSSGGFSTFDAQMRQPPHAVLNDYEQEAG